MEKPTATSINSARAHNFFGCIFHCPSFNFQLSSPAAYRDAGSKNLEPSAIVQGAHKIARRLQEAVGLARVCNQTSKVVRDAKRAGTRGKRRALRLESQSPHAWFAKPPSRRDAVFWVQSSDWWSRHQGLLVWPTSGQASSPAWLCLACPIQPALC